MIKQAAGPIIHVLPKDHKVFKFVSDVRAAAFTLTPTSLKKITDRHLKSFLKKHDLPYSTDQVRKHGIIVYTEGTQHDKFITEHEMTHWLRSKKNKWSSRNYNSMLGGLIEETAAYRRGVHAVPSMRTFKNVLGPALAAGQIAVTRPIRSALALSAAAGLTYYGFKKKKK